MQMPLFDPKILDNCREIEHSGDTLVLRGVNGHDLDLTYRRGVSETWQVRLTVHANLEGKHVSLYSAECPEEAIRFWQAAGQKEFEKNDQFREAAYPRITDMLNKPKAKRVKKQ